MRLLAIETSTEACSVALLIDGEVRERHELAPRRHTQLVLPWADELLAEAGIGRASLDAIAVGRGPGAFTGVRLAIALVQGMALALDRPVLPVSTLAVLAVQGRPGRVLASIDARMGEVYAGLFDRDEAGQVVAAGAEVVSPAGAVMLPEGEMSAVGTGLAADGGALALRLGTRATFIDAAALPHAADLARLAEAAWHRGEAIAADAIEPAYLRDKVALTLVEQGKAKA
jgi:tRNA threonylcarbamoyladenosine biosynthesis protein TsaB